MGNKELDYRIPQDSAWHKAWMTPAIAAVAGGIGLGLFGSGDLSRLGYAYLFGFAVVLTFFLGALFLVVTLHITGGHWAVTMRRIAEKMIWPGAWVVALLALPLIGGVVSGHFHMYDEWLGGHHGAEHGDAAHGDAEHGDDGHGSDGHARSGFLGNVAHAQDPHAGIPNIKPVQGLKQQGLKKQGRKNLRPGAVVKDPTKALTDGSDGVGARAPGAHVAHSPQQQALHHHVLAHKSPYLNKNRWLGFAFIYLLVWIGLGFFFATTSFRQDTNKELKETRTMRKFAPLAAMLFGLTLTFAAFDWLMSLEPAWYSTIFGVVIFAGAAMSIFALLIVIGLSLSKAGLVGKAINVEHFHDLGKLMFGFMCFWAYVSFSQWMLIWYAGIPEEATWFHKRWAGPWQYVSIFLMLGHFALPFYFMISRIVKRNLELLRQGAYWLLFMQVVDIYWYVLPQAGAGVGNVVLDLSALLFAGGAFFAAVFYAFRSHALIPVGDPLLERGLHHHQTH